MNFPRVLLGNSIEKCFNVEYCDQDWRLCWKIVIKYFGKDWGVTDRGVIVL